MPMTPRAGRSAVLRELWRLAPVPLSTAAAVRAAAATGAPLLVAEMAHRPEMFWMATGGFLAALVDRGASYRARAVNFAVVSAGMVAAGAVAGLLGHGTAQAVVGMLLWGALVSFLRVYGPAGANVGLTSSVIFAVSLGAPVPLEGSLERGAWLLAGGAWAALLVLLVWPLRPDLPARRALARCYGALAEYARDLEGLAHRGGGEHGAAGRSFDAVRGAIEEAWTALGSRWSGLPPRTPPHSRLLVLLECADQMLGTLVALSDLVERIPESSARGRLTVELRQLAEETTALAGAIARDHHEPPDRLGWGSSGLASDVDLETSEPALRQTERLLRTLRGLARTARELLAGADPTGGRVPAPGTTGSAPAGWLEPIRANLSGDSVLLRHALRVGVTTAVAIFVSRLFHLQLGQWVTLTVVFVLQPNVGTTVVKAFQRVLGTALGAVAAAVLPLLVHSPALLLTLLAALAAAAVVTLPINYALFTFFVTPTFVVLTEVQTGLTGLPGTRVVNTLIGGLLAIAGTRLVWSLPERRRFPAHAAAALHIARDFLRAVAEAPPARVAVGEAAALRRQLGLEIMNAGESLHRLEIEGGPASDRVEAGHTILVYLRRLTSASVSLGVATERSHAEMELIRQFVAGAARTLTETARAIAAGVPPPPFQPLIDNSWPAQLRSDLERIDRPLRVLHGAAHRLAGTRSS